MRHATSSTLAAWSQLLTPVRALVSGMELVGSGTLFVTGGVLVTTGGVLVTMILVSEPEPEPLVPPPLGGFVRPPSGGLVTTIPPPPLLDVSEPLPVTSQVARPSYMVKAMPLTVLPSR